MDRVEPDTFSSLHVRLAQFRSPPSCSMHERLGFVDVLGGMLRCVRHVMRLDRIIHRIVYVRIDYALRLQIVSRMRHVARLSSLPDSDSVRLHRNINVCWQTGCVGYRGSD